ncbi:MAG: hypothetical protein K5945_04875 [Bacteroidaceae bacterium]|nr:hypothetical protein [Bacteroidaceae bacterium]
MAGDYTSQFRTLFTELQRYLRLQKRYLALDTAEKLVVILSTVAIAVVCFVLGALLLFFLSFALALWLGHMMGNSSLGFLSIAGALAIILYLVYKQRTQWLVMPIARLIVGLFDRTEKEQESGNDELPEEEGV